MWYTILKFVLSIADGITSYMNNKKMLDAGSALALKGTYEEAFKKIDAARAARNNLSSDSDSVLGDDNLRD